MIKSRAIEANGNHVVELLDGTRIHIRFDTMRVVVSLPSHAPPPQVVAIPPAQQKTAA